LRVEAFLVRAGPLSEILIKKTMVKLNPKTAHSTLGIIRQMPVLLCFLKRLTINVNRTH
jgi:hypothetical protein